MRKVCAIVLACSLLVPAAGYAQKAAPSPDETILGTKCSLCHSGHRVYDADPDKVQELVDRMVKKNPEWFKDTDKQHLVAVLPLILKDPEVVARRKAWQETVGKGKALFADASLGKSGQSCASCHKPEKLREYRDTFPRFDQKLGRFLTFQETINLMLVEKMDGAALPLGDPRAVALEVFLKTLK